MMQTKITITNILSTIIETKLNATKNNTYLMMKYEGKNMNFYVNVLSKWELIMFIYTSYTYQHHEIKNNNCIYCLAFNFVSNSQIKNQKQRLQKLKLNEGYFSQNKNSNNKQNESNFLLFYKMK